MHLEENIQVGLPRMASRLHHETADHVRAGSNTLVWGWLAPLSIVNAIALLLVAIADTSIRNGSMQATTLFWTGLVLLFAPAAIRLTMSSPTRRERVGILLMVGLSMYLVKVFHSPLAFTFHDEFIHWRSTLDIVQTGRLFHENPLITVSPFYPGLQIVTSTVMSVTGLDIFFAGVLVLAIGRIILVLSLYLFYTELSGSARFAGIATLLYMCNPNFLFFDAQFAYESLAIPLMALTLFAIVRRARSKGEGRLALNMLILISLCAVVTTHHMTSFALVAFLTLWTLTPFLWRIMLAFGSWYENRASSQELGNVVVSQARALWKQLIGAARTTEQLMPGEITLVAFVFSLAWLIYVASLVIGYLAPVFDKAFSEVLSLIAGNIPSRQLFTDYTGQRPPLWQQLVGYSSVLLIVFMLPISLVRGWRLYRNNPLALTLAVGTLGYPIALSLRFTQAGQEASNRSSEFLFLPIAFILTLGITSLWLSSKRRWLRTLPFAVFATSIFIGGAIVGWPPWARFPASYLVSADTRSVEPEGIDAAKWAKDNLGSNHRVGADRVNRLLMSAYGDQRVVTNLSEGVNVAYLFWAPEIGPVERGILAETRLEYAVVDLRMTTGLPVSGNYFEAGEPNSNEHITPFELAPLAKFDQLAGVERVFDSGNIVIYNVGTLTNAP